MIIRVFATIFVSVISGVCYLAGLLRLMSALLLAFGVIAALFFGIIFLLPAGGDHVWFPLYGDGSPWPFFSVGAILVLMIVWLLLGRNRPMRDEELATAHYGYLASGLLAYLCSLFLPAFFWFPSEEKLILAEASSLAGEVFLGVCFYLAGSSLALFLLYRSAKGTTAANPDLMRRFILALFAFFQLDKMPALVAYLLIYSPETHIVFPKLAALALAGYLPVGLFLARLSFAAQQE